MLDVPLIRAPLPVRVMGWGMVAMGLGAPILLVGSATDDEPLAGFVIVLFLWGVFAIWLGLRTARMGVSVDNYSMTVRNQIRTRRIPLNEISGIEIRRVLAVWALGTQTVGFVVTNNGEVIIDASRSLRSPLTLGLPLFSQTKTATRVQMSRLAEHIGVSLDDQTIQTP